MHYYAFAVNKVPVGVLGASGYVGRELCALINGHPSLTLAFATANEQRGVAVRLGGRDVTFIASEDAALGKAELVFSATYRTEKSRFTKDTARQVMAMATMISNHLLLPTVERFARLHFLRRYVLFMRWGELKVTSGVTAAFIQRFEGPVNDLVAPIDHTLADTQIGVAVGYMHPSWVFVDQYEAGGFELVNHHAAQIVAHVGSRAHLSVEEPDALGTAGAVGKLLPWIGGRAVLTLNADAWHDEPLAALTDGWDGATIRMLVVHEPRERSMVADRGAGGRLTPDDLPVRLEADAVLVSGYTLLFEPTFAAGMAALERASARFVAVDAASWPMVRSFGVDRFLEAKLHRDSCALCVPPRATTWSLRPPTGEGRSCEQARRGWGQRRAGSVGEDLGAELLGGGVGQVLVLDDLCGPRERRHPDGKHKCRHPR